MSRTSASIALSALLLLSLPSWAQNIVGKDNKNSIPNPVSHDITGMFQKKYVTVGDDMYIGGQPSEKALRELHDSGVTTVINLRMPEEMDRIGFDEEALVKQLGMNYVHIPMRGTYTPAQLDEFSSAMSSARGKVLLHCTVAWRASHLWAAYLIRDRKVKPDVAIAQARSINLMDHMRMGNQQPIEGFLGRTVPEIEHPPARNEHVQ